MNKNQLEKLIAGSLDQELLKSIMTQNDPETDFLVDLNIKGLALELSGIDEGVGTVFVISSDGGEYIETYRGPIDVNVFAKYMVDKMESVNLANASTKNVVGDARGMYDSLVHEIVLAKPTTLDPIPFINGTQIEPYYETIHVIYLNGEGHVVPSGNILSVPKGTLIYKEFISKLTLLDVVLYMCSDTFQNR